MIKTTILKFDNDVKKDRNTYIGGSDAGAILGLNPWKSAYTLWLEKTGQKVVEDISDKEQVWWGVYDEEGVAQRFCIKADKKVQKSNALYALEDYPFIRGHIDRKVVGEDAILECKTTSAWSTTDYEGGEIPPMYYAQCMHYLMVTGYSKCYIAIKKNNTNFYWFEIKRNEDEIKKLLEAELKFWECVETLEPPAIDGSKSTTDSLNERYQSLDNTEPLTLSEDVNEIAEQIKETDALISDLKDKSDGLKNQVREMMKDHAKAYTTKYEFNWKTRVSNRIDSTRLKKERPDIYKEYVKESTSRPFSFKEMKG